LCEPISKPVQIASERSERPDRIGIARGADGRHVNRRTDIDRCRIWMYRQHAPLFTAPFCFHHDNVPPSLEQKEGLGRGEFQFPNRDRSTASPLSSPQQPMDHVFLRG
jgi:hypothetical protein